MKVDQCEKLFISLILYLVTGIRQELVLIVHEEGRPEGRQEETSQSDDGLSAPRTGSHHSEHFPLQTLHDIDLELNLLMK